MVGLALAIRASPNAVGKEATPPEFTLFEAPVYAPGLQSTCVRSCLETRDRRNFRRSLGGNIQRAWSSECQANRLPLVGPVATWRMQRYRVISPESVREAPQSYAITISFIGIKKRSRKSNKSCKPLLCLRSCLRSSRAFRLGPRGALTVLALAPTRQGALTQTASQGGPSFVVDQTGTTAVLVLASALPEWAATADSCDAQGERIPRTAQPTQGHAQGEDRGLGLTSVFR
jgi:hypothetical protein